MSEYCDFKQMKNGVFTSIKLSFCVLSTGGTQQIMFFSLWLLLLFQLFVFCLLNRNHLVRIANCQKAKERMEKSNNMRAERSEMYKQCMSLFAFTVKPNEHLILFSSAARCEMMDLKAQRKTNDDEKMRWDKEEKINAETILPKPHI